MNAAVIIPPFEPASSVEACHCRSRHPDAPSVAPGATGHGLIMSEPDQQLVDGESLIKAMPHAGGQGRLRQRRKLLILP
jgi:hypothetical protein